MSPSTISLYLGPPPPPLESLDDFGLWSHFDAIVGDDGFDSPSTFDTDALPRLAHDDHRELETMGKPPPPSSPSQQPLVSVSPMTSGVAAASILLLLIGKANYRPRKETKRRRRRQFCDSCTLYTHMRARTQMNSFIGWCWSRTGTTVPETHSHHCSHARIIKYTHRKETAHLSQSQSIQLPTKRQPIYYHVRHGIHIYMHTGNTQDQAHTHTHGVFTIIYALKSENSSIFRRAVQLGVNSVHRLVHQVPDMPDISPVILPVRVCRRMDGWSPSPSLVVLPRQAPSKQRLLAAVSSVIVARSIEAWATDEASIDGGPRETRTRPPAPC